MENNPTTINSSRFGVFNGQSEVYVLRNDFLTPDAAWDWANDPANGLVVDGQLRPGVFTSEICPIHSFYPSAGCDECRYMEERR